MTINYKILAIVLCSTPLVTNAGSKDDPLLTMVSIDRLAWVENEDDTYLFEGEVWLGYDLNKAWFKVEAERHQGATEEIELQALYSRAIAPYWDFQAGVRKDLLPDPDQHWAVVGFKGLAPYFFEVDSALFIGESGQTGLRLAAEYEMMLTQQWVLSPEVEVNFFGKDDAERGQGSGLADSELSLQLRYEITPKFAPFIEVSRSNYYGNTADFIRAEGEATSSTEYLIGFRAWF